LLPRPGIVPADGYRSSTADLPAVAVRDSTHPDGGILVFTPEAWRAFVDGAKDGEFDR
jgi:Domain of unknown function (DUF397)